MRNTTITQKSRSLLFHIFLMLCTGFFGILLLPAIFIPDRYSVPFARKLGKRWAKTILYSLKPICNIEYKIKNMEILENSAPCLIACKHQSMFETVLFLAILPEVGYVVKKELMKIPVYGHYLKSMRMLPVDRKGGAAALRGMNKAVVESLEKHSMVIFPEGARVPYGTVSRCRGGVFSIYQESDRDIIPIAVNSGAFWPKAISSKSPGTIEVTVHRAIKKGLGKEEMLDSLNDAINTL